MEKLGIPCIILSTKDDFCRLKGGTAVTVIWDNILNTQTSVVVCKLNLESIKQAIYINPNYLAVVFKVK